jgi:hypothetical protein
MLLKSIYTVKQVLSFLNFEEKMCFEHQILQSKMKLEKIDRCYLKM